MQNNYIKMVFGFALSWGLCACNNGNTSSKPTRCASDAGDDKSDASHTVASGHAGNDGHAGSSSGTGGTGGSASAHDAGSGPGSDSDGGESSTSVTVPNLAASAIKFDGLGDVELTQADCTIDTDEGTIGCGVEAALYHYQAVDQSSGGDRVALFLANSVRIGSSAAVRVKGSLPLVLVAKNTIQIFGELSASGAHDVAVAGGSVASTTGKGGGPGGGGAQLSYSAAGGGSFCGKGGMGNAVGTDLSGVGGPAYGTPELVPLLAGSAGGGEATYAGGGAGGGAIELVAGQQITVATTGMVHVGGGGGGAGTNGCGGGSGGAILIEAPSVEIDGILAANGGGGNINNGGAAGQNGQPSETPAQGGSITAGHGSAGSEIDGANGSIDATSSNNSSGGGGGGAGRIRINSKDGKAVIHGTISPALATTCVTQGTL